MAKTKADPKVVAAEKAIEKAVIATEKAKAAVSEAAQGKKHPRQLNKARSAIQSSFESLHRADRWIARWNKLDI